MRERPAAAAAATTVAAPTAAAAAPAATATIRATTPASISVTVPPPAPAVKARTPFRTRTRRLMKAVLILLALIIVGKEIRISIAASALADVVGSQDLTAINQTWNQYRRADRWQPADWRTSTRARAGQPHHGAGRERDRQLQGFERHRLGEPVAAGTRCAGPLAAPNRSSRSREAALRYCEGHLHRIDGEARTAELRAAVDKGGIRKGDEEKGPAAQRELTAAVTAFREAAELRPDWPDPFLGLMRTFVASTTSNAAPTRWRRPSATAMPRIAATGSSSAMAISPAATGWRQSRSSTRSCAPPTPTRARSSCMARRSAIAAPGNGLRDAQRQLQQVSGGDRDAVHAGDPRLSGPGGTE